MNIQKMKPNVPDFCWDRDLSAEQIRRQLHDASDFEWIRIASWIIREAAFSDIWLFLNPGEVSRHMNELAPYLGRRRNLLEYIIGAWRELGRI